MMNFNQDYPTSSITPPYFDSNGGGDDGLKDGLDQRFLNVTVQVGNDIHLKAWEYDAPMAHFLFKKGLCPQEVEKLDLDFCRGRFLQLLRPGLPEWVRLDRDRIFE
ncbi:hypothetical protein Tco_0752072 [Tanacetum coccineum]|uniref:Uncharacterized protein n=1 Tax=Tanacetum coccineum TaxID=301880 RepID=A0ABQ4Z8F9_9ASTR